MAFVEELRALVGKRVVVFLLGESVIGKLVTATDDDVVIKYKYQVDMSTPAKWHTRHIRPNAIIAWLDPEGEAVRED